MGWFSDTAKRLIGKAVNSDTGRRLIGKVAGAAKSLIGKIEPIYNKARGIPVIGDALQHAAEKLGLARDGKSAFHAAHEAIYAGENHAGLYNLPPD